MRKTTQFLLPAGALLLAVVAAPAPAIAGHELAATAKHAEQAMEKFEERLDHELDKLVIDGTNDEDRLEKYSEKLRDRLDEIHDEVKDAEDEEAREELTEALAAARPINDAMRDYAFSPALKRLWAEISADLNKMAAQLSLPTLVVVVVD